VNEIYSNFTGGYQMTKDQEYLKWQHIIENHHLSTQGFLDYVEYFHTKESDEYIVAQYYLNSSNLNEFLDKFFSYNPDDLLNDLLSFIEYQIEEELRVC
jgi:hypothetical protein